MSLLQSGNGGINSGSVAGSYTSSGATPNYASNTTAGSLLLCVCTASSSGTVTAGTPSITAGPTTSGASGAVWTLLASVAFTGTGLGAHNSAVLAVYYIVNAPSISAADTTEFTASFTNGSGVQVFAVIENLLEFSAIDPNPLDTFATATGPQASVSATANLLTTATDLVLSINFAGSLTQGAGYAKISPTQGNLNVQYVDAVAAGSVSTAWGGTQSNFSEWGCIAVAFKDAGLSQPILQISPSTLSFSAIESGANPASQNVAISNGDGGTLNWTVASDQSWLSGAPSSGTGNASVVVSVNISGLVGGTYTGHLTVTAAGATGSPKIVTVTMTVLTSTGGGGGGGGGGGTACIPTYANGVFVPDLSLYIGPSSALYKTPVPTSQIIASESTVEGRNAIILDFNNTEGLYTRDFETVFTWPLGVGTVLDIWQPSIVPSQDELYNRLSYHFLMTSLGMEGWGTIRELNLAHNASSDLTLLLTFDQWPPITLTIPNSGGVETKVKITVPANKFKLVEGFVSSGQPFMLWVSDCEMKVGQWGRTDSYRLVRPFV